MCVFSSVCLTVYSVVVGSFLGGTLMLRGPFVMPELLLEVLPPDYEQSSDNAHLSWSWKKWSGGESGFCTARSEEEPFFYYCCGCCWRLTWWLAQRLMPGQVRFKLEDIVVPGRPREPKDTNMISTSLSLHCGALKTLTLLDLHMPRCQGADQLGPECCCPS